MVGGKEGSGEEKSLERTELERSWSGADSDDYCESKGIFEELRSWGVQKHREAASVGGAGAGEGEARRTRSKDIQVEKHYVF